MLTVIVNLLIVFVIGLGINTGFQLAGAYWNGL